MKNMLSRHMSLSLALRYLNPLRTYFSVITLICLMGVALGVMVLVVVLSVMGGLRKDMEDRILAYSSHLQVGYSPIEGVRGTMGEWQHLTEAISKVPGVQSSYALVEDYALVDAEGMQRPCFFRAIDTENVKQMEELQHLIKEGTFELDMGEKVVVSSLVAESLNLSVGDTLRVYTTRNFQEISNTYSQMDKPLLADSFRNELKELKTIASNVVASGDGELWSKGDLDKAVELTDKIGSKTSRPAEGKLLAPIFEVCNFSVEEMQTEGEKFLLPKGTATGWKKSLDELLSMNRDKADVESMKMIKNLILPKDLEVIGIYQATQHVASPDLFLPLGIGQELVGFNDDLVQGIAVRLDNLHELRLIMPLVQKALPEMNGGASWVIESWEEKYESFFDLMQTERMMMSFVLSFIALISAFCIMAVMFTVAIQRKKELAVMKALGATPWQIVRVFLWQGVIIGFTGAILGIGMGLLVLHYRVEIHTILAGVGFDPFPMPFHGVEIPSSVNPVELLSQGLRAFVMVVAASVVPAIIAAYQDPAKALRSM